MFLKSFFGWSISNRNFVEYLAQVYPAVLILILEGSANGWKRRPLIPQKKRVEVRDCNSVLCEIVQLFWYSSYYYILKFLSLKSCIKLICLLNLS